MYQDGYVARREFLQKVKDAIFDIDIDGELNNFIFNRKCYGPSDYYLFNLLFLKIVDLRKELASGNKSMISQELYEAIGENLKHKRQTILLCVRQ